VRSAGLVVAVFIIAVSMVGVISPDSLTTVRRLYFATPVGLYAAGAVRVAMGLTVILCASQDRARARPNAGPHRDFEDRPEAPAYLTMSAGRGVAR